MHAPVRFREYLAQPNADLDPGCAPVSIALLTGAAQRYIIPPGRDAILLPFGATTLSAFPGIAATRAGLGAVLFVPAGTCSSAGFEDLHSAYLLLLDPRLGRLVNAALAPCGAKVPEIAFFMPGTEPVRALVPLIRRFGAGSDNPGTALALRALAELLLHEIAQGHAARASAVSRELSPRPRRPARAPKLQPHQIAAIDGFIDRNIENVLRIDDLAAQVCLSRYHFLRCFKHATGSSPLQYVLARRLAHARQLLAQSDESIAAVAYAVGFSSQSHLNAMFKRHFGVTPGAFVRAHRRPAAQPEPALAQT